MKHLDEQLTPDEWDDLLRLLNERFGPRPSDQNELWQWKLQRYPYLYGAGKTMYKQPKTWEARKKR